MKYVMIQIRQIRYGFSMNIAKRKAIPCITEKVTICRVINVPDNVSDQTVLELLRPNIRLPLEVDFSIYASSERGIHAVINF